MKSNEISWPEQYLPHNSAVHVVNRMQMQASSQAVWDRLIRATDWPNWYPNAANVRLLDTDSETLELEPHKRSSAKVPDQEIGANNGLLVEAPMEASGLGPYLRRQPGGVFQASVTHN